MIRTSWSYATAFALPAVLLGVATTVLFSGRRRYRQVAPCGSVVTQCLSAMALALWQLLLEKTGKRPITPVRKRTRHVNSKFTFRWRIGWIERFLATDMRWLPIYVQRCLWQRSSCQCRRFGRCSINMRVVGFCKYSTMMNTIVCLIPLRQAQHLNRDVFGWHLDADQMPLLNPVFTLLLIPCFDYGLYPLIAKTGIKFTPLRKIGLKTNSSKRLVLVFICSGTGMFLASLAFVWAAMVEMSINNQGNEKVHCAWQIGQFFLLTCGEVMTSITCLEFAYTQVNKKQNWTIKKNEFLLVRLR